MGQSTHRGCQGGCQQARCPIRIEQRSRALGSHALGGLHEGTFKVGNGRALKDRTTQQAPLGSPSICLPKSDVLPLTLRKLAPFHCDKFCILKGHKNSKMFTVRKCSVCFVSFYNIRNGHKGSPVFWNIQKWKEYAKLRSSRLLSCLYAICIRSSSLSSPLSSSSPPLSGSRVLIPDGLGPTKGYFLSKGNFSSPLLLVWKFYILV